MGKVRIECHGDREVLIVDYSDCNEAGMIEVFEKAKTILQNKNRVMQVLSIFNRKNYVTPNYIRQIEKGLREVEGLIGKNAVVGLTQTQKWILKGINLWYTRQIYHFDSFDEAVEFISTE